LVTLKTPVPGLLALPRNAVRYVEAMLLANIISFVKETLTDAGQVVATRGGVKNIYQVSLYRNAFYLVLYSAANSLTGILFWIAAARLYSTEAVGLASAGIAAIGLVAIFSSLGLDYGLIRFLPDVGNRASDTINTCFTTTGLITVVLAGIFMAGLAVWSPALLSIRESPAFLVSFLCLGLLFTVSGFAVQVFIARRQSGYTLAQGLIFGLSRFIPLFLLVSIYSSLGIYVSWGSAVAASALIGIFFFLPRVLKGYRPRLTIKKAVLTEMFRFSLANYISSIFWSLPMVVLPLTIVNILGAEQNAYFHVGWSVASVIFIIPVGTSQSLYAEGSHDQETLGREVRKSVKISLVLIVPALIIIMTLGDKILWLFGKAYSENTTKLIWIIAPSVIPMSINFIYLSIKRVQKRMKRAVFLTVFMAVITLSLSYFLLPVIGILGAGVAWLAGQAGAALFVIYEYLIGRRQSSVSRNIVSPEKRWT
jgi:O-antigen/teichoic acid export membrane protein